jgi:hypothetical protein
MESFQEIANRKGAKTQRKARKGKRMKSIAGSLDAICCSPRNSASIFTFAPYLLTFLGISFASSRLCGEGLTL